MPTNLFFNLFLKLFVVVLGLLMALLAVANMGIIFVGLCLATVLHYVPWILAILPGIFISFYIYWRDRHSPEPHFNLIKTFIIGGIATYPAIKMEEYGIHTMGLLPSADIWDTFWFAFGVIAFSEEIAKLWFLRVFIVPKKDFNEPMDGIVYAVMLGMGFATWENILYVVYRNGGAEVALMRMFTAVPAHAAFAMLMGYFVGLSRFAPTWKLSALYLFLSLLLPVLVHGIYDFFIFQQNHEYLILVTFASLLGSLYLGWRLLGRQERRSFWARTRQELADSDKSTLREG